MALALNLLVEQRKLAAKGTTELEGVVSRAVHELQAAMDELRELSHGVHPTILAQAGLGPALASLAERAPIRVELGPLPVERLAPEIEATACYVACEALTNAVKHGRASRVTIDAERENGSLVVRVADDGVGGADPAGYGLRGIADRVEAQDGRLRIESAPGAGTRVIGEIPCGS